MLPMMIVDDSSVIRRKIDRFNEDSKLFEVVAIAENGEQAVKQFHSVKPQIITMDLTMPHMDGIQCIEAIMATGERPKILVVSALSDKATGIEALHKGARGFLCKPFTEKQLNTALLELIGGSSL